MGEVRSFLIIIHSYVRQPNLPPGLCHKRPSWNLGHGAGPTAHSLKAPAQLLHAGPLPHAPACIAGLFL